MGKNVFASPLLDSTFKLVFGEKNHTQLTIDFLNDLLERTGQSNEIKKIVFTHQELAPRRFDNKKSILDINCTDIQDNQFIIEIQRQKQDYFDWRLFYYAASLLSRQLKETEPYSKLKPVVILAILNFKLYEEGNEAVTHHKMCDMRTGEQSINLIEVHTVELGKFNKKVNQLVSHIDKWLFFLKKAHDQELIPAVYDDTPSIRQAFDVLARWKWTPRQIAAYDKEVMDFQMQITQELADAEKLHALNSALQKAQVELAQAQQATQQVKEESALNALKLGLTIEQAASVSGLSIEQVEELKNR